MSEMPVFVIKAKDALAPEAVEAYRDLCRQHGLNEQAAQVQLALDEIEGWQQAHPDDVRSPSHVHVPAAGQETEAEVSDAHHEGFGAGVAWADDHQRVLGMIAAHRDADAKLRDQLADVTRERDEARREVETIRSVAWSNKRALAHALEHSDATARIQLGAFETEIRRVAQRLADQFDENVVVKGDREALRVSNARLQVELDEAIAETAAEDAVIVAARAVLAYDGEDHPHSGMKFMTVWNDLRWALAAVDALPASHAVDVQVADAPGSPGARVLAEIAAERTRQDDKWGEQNHRDGTGRPGSRERADAARARCKANGPDEDNWQDILDEEIQEAFDETDPELLIAELIQVAAVAAQWVEAIRRRPATPAASPLALPGCTCPWNNGIKMMSKVGHHISCPTLTGSHTPNDHCNPHPYGGHLGYAQAGLWVCPVVEHRQRNDHRGMPVVTVEWDGDVAHCTAHGCGRNSSLDDGACNCDGDDGEGNECVGQCCGAGNCTCGPDAPPADAGWHVGRTWAGHRVEDACPCSQEPCGLVDLNRADVACTEHRLTAGKTLRQGHSAADCPGARPAETEDNDGAMSRNTHLCPGRCGTSVRQELLACSPCWWRLPEELRRAVNLAFPRRSTDPARHRTAVADALGWYRDNRIGVDR